LSVTTLLSTASGKPLGSGRELSAPRLLAESHLERRIGKGQTDTHQCDEDGAQDESGNKRIFHARRIRLTEKSVQGALPYVRAAQ
jgi:hypothetical protein